MPIPIETAADIERALESFARVPNNGFSGQRLRGRLRRVRSSRGSLWSGSSTSYRPTRTLTVCVRSAGA